MIDYIVKECRDPRNPDVKGKYYAKAVKRGTVGTKELARRIATSSGHSIGSVVGLVEDIMAAAVHFMKQGCNIQLSDYSRLQLVVSSELSEDEKKVNVTNIRKVYVRYQNESFLISGCSFERVYPINAKSKSDTGEEPLP